MYVLRLTHISVLSGGRGMLDRQRGRHFERSRGAGGRRKAIARRVDNETSYAPLPLARVVPSHSEGFRATVPTKDGPGKSDEVRGLDLPTTCFSTTRHIIQSETFTRMPERLIAGGMRKSTTELYGAQ